MNLFDKVDEYVAYAGIGSRDTPEDICKMMTDIARILDDRGYVLRSGGAEGADRAFDMGTHGMAHPEIYLPWEGFNGQRMTMTPSAAQIGDATGIAAKFHPAWYNCSEGARKMHTRNVFQVLGLDLKHPSKFVICWTKDGKSSGGTGQALRIAEAHKIPIFNLQKLEHRQVMYKTFAWPDEG